MQQEARRCSRARDRTEAPPSVMHHWAPLAALDPWSRRESRYPSTTQQESWSCYRTGCHGRQLQGWQVKRSRLGWQTCRLLLPGHTPVSIQMSDVRVARLVFEVRIRPLHDNMPAKDALPVAVSQFCCAQKTCQDTYGGTTSTPITSLGCREGAVWYSLEATLTTGTASRLLHS